MKNKEIQKALCEPFGSEDVEWRVQNTTKNKDKGMAVAYITSRAIQKRLDETVGPYCWRVEYKPWHLVGGKTSQICGLSILDEARNEWITKWDGADATEFEPIKGGISDAFKRAAVLWGIGRYLYALDEVWVDVEPRGNSYAIVKSELKRLDNSYNSAVAKMFSQTKPTTAVTVNTANPAKTPAPFDYIISEVKQKKHSMVLKLAENASGKEVVAFLQGKSAEIAEGVCLKDVKITRCEATDTTPSYNTIDSYKIAA